MWLSIQIKMLLISSWKFKTNEQLWWVFFEISTTGTQTVPYGQESFFRIKAWFGGEVWRRKAATRKMIILHESTKQLSGCEAPVWIPQHNTCHHAWSATCENIDRMNEWMGIEQKEGKKATILDIFKFVTFVIVVIQTDCCHHLSERSSMAKQLIHAGKMLFLFCTQ